MSHRIFVYGTLRQGFGNHRLLADSRFIGRARTAEKMAMFGRGIPFVNKSQELYQVIGEVYEVDEPTLKRLDSLEGHPDWYVRTPLDVILEDSEEIIQAEIYFNEESSHLNPTGDYAENRKALA